MCFCRRCWVSQSFLLTEMSPGLLGIKTRPQLSEISLSAAHPPGRTHTEAHIDTQTCTRPATPRRGTPYVCQCEQHGLVRSIRGYSAAGAQKAKLVASQLVFLSVQTRWTGAEQVGTTWNIYSSSASARHPDALQLHAHLL